MKHIKERPMIWQGLSVVRFAEATDLEGERLAKRLKDNYGELVSVRTLEASGERRGPAQIRVRLTDTKETRQRFGKTIVRKELAGIAFLKGELLKEVPSLSDPLPITFKEAHVGEPAWFRTGVIAVPDEKSQLLLQEERAKVLAAIEDITGVNSVPWSTEPIESILAIGDRNEVKPKIMRGVANLATSHCPVEMTFGPAAFESSSQGETPH